MKKIAQTHWVGKAWRRLTVDEGFGLFHYANSFGIERKLRGKDSAEELPKW